MKKQVLATLAIVLLWGVATSQVGINTTDPADGSILDIDSDDKGILIPRVNISNLNNIAPITGGSPEGLLVYNTNTTTGPGYFYWNGSSWVAVGSERGWGLTGNAGTNAANNFVGTTDTQALTFKTNSTARLTIPNANQIHANSSGTAALPFYSFADDSDTGMYRISTNVLGFATNSNMRMRINANGNVGINVNPTERLHVSGNFRLQGAFMPNNQAGNQYQMLLSGGSGNSPTWGPRFISTANTQSIGKFYTALFDINNNIYLTLTITDSNMTQGTSIAYNLVGNLPAGPQWGNNFRILAETRNGAVVFYITNVSGYHLSNLQIAYHALYGD